MSIDVNSSAVRAAVAGFFVFATLASLTAPAAALIAPVPCEMQHAPRAKKLSIFLEGGYLGDAGRGVVQGEGLYFDLALGEMKAATVNQECEWDVDDVRWFVRAGASWLSGVTTDTDRAEGNLSLKYVLTSSFSAALGISGGGLWQSSKDRGFPVGPLARLDYGDWVSLEASGARIFGARGLFDQSHYSFLVGLTVRASLWEEHVTRRTTAGAANP